MKRKTLVGAVATALIGIALATSPLAVAKPEDQFIQLLQDAGLTWPPGDTEAIIAAGKGVCLDFDAGNSWSDEVGSIAANTAWNTYDADYFAVAAVNAFCPEHAGLYGS